MSKMKIRFFTIADYEEEERWLRQQHQSGLRLTRFTPPCFFHFEECPPEDVIYRLDYKNDSQGRDYLQLFRDYGWEYVSTCLGWFYFRKPASQVQGETDGEIFSDNLSKVEMLQHIVRTRMLPLLIIFLCCVLPNWSWALFQSNVPMGVMFTTLVLLYAFLLLYCGLKLRGLKQKYSGG